MTEGLPNSFLYEHSDVPHGESLSSWKRRQPRRPERRAQLTGGFLAAFATIAPLILSVRGVRRG
jgi:hypothetical protein